MRIKDHEYQDIISALSKAGFVIEDFEFVKKKGWFHLIKKDKDRFFSFHRKVEVEIREGKFEEWLEYRFKTDSNSGSSDSWIGIKKVLTHWLRDINDQDPALT